MIEKCAVPFPLRAEVRVEELRDLFEYFSVRRVPTEAWDGDFHRLAALRSQHLSLRDRAAASRPAAAPDAFG
jgi:hypothetical protein